MALIPSILLLFDTTALMAGKATEWQEFLRLGECYIPQGVFEQVEYLCDRASEPALESVAREFVRFYPNSGWKKNTVQAEHPNLKPAPGHSLSKRARLSLEVLNHAYGLALRYPERLIVLVANDQSMLQQAMGLQVKNLCAIPVSPLMQWVRTQRRPQVVNHHLQWVRVSSSASERTGDRGKSTPPRSAVTAKPASTRDITPATRPGMYTAKRQRVRVRSRQLFSLISNIVSLVIFLGVLATIWHFVSPGSFYQFWNSLPFIGRPR